MPEGKTLVRGESGAVGRSGLPASFEREVHARIGWVALLFLGLAAFALVTDLAGFGNPAGSLVRRLVLPSTMAISLGVFLLARFAELSVRGATLLGIGFEVAICASVAFLVNVSPMSPDVVLVGWSPVAVLVVLYAALVPNTVARTALASSLAALMDPVALVILRLQQGAPLPSAELFAQRFLPHVAAVGCAMVIGRVVYRLEEEVSEARQMGSYRLETLLGRGGMGEVWLAKHQALARPAAVKLIRPEQLDRDQPGVAKTLIQRFRKEVQITASLRSPHTVEVYEFGTSANGAFFYVMELLDGLDMHSLVMRHGPQPATRVVFLLEQVCHSLREAHAAGLVHRDIKPANVYVCRYGADLDFVKVLDFGLAKGDLPGEAHVSLTRPGVHIGTPAFMPPEIALRTGEVDGRADLYAVGCLAYWLLTGELVFPIGPPLKMVTQHAKEAPIPPSERRPGLDIPEELERIVLLCLEKEPAHRPASARELARMLSELGLSARWTEEERERWWRRNGPPPAGS